MRISYALSAAASTLAIGIAALPGAAFAQSTGSQEFEKDIVVTGTRGPQQVAGISAPDTAKAKAVLTQENLAHQNPGQTVLDSINQIPSVNFQNNDAYGSSGGTLNIRGFSSDRVSLTFDGVPLNDSGNYAIFSNQQVDPEVIEQVSVNLGTTDVDSPTASAAGGTVNLRTKKPDRNFGAMMSGSMGQFDFMRVFAKIETGEFTPSGTRAFISASTASNRLPFNNYGRIDKKQLNAKIYQPLSGDDFISVAGHYNQNRNNFFGSVPLRTDLTQSLTNGAIRIVGPNSSNRFPLNKGERFYNINYPCTTAVARPGLADTPAAAPANQASCGTEFDRRYNPSNTGNIRVQARFSLRDNLVLNIEPSYQYVKANGGGTVTASEGLRDINPADPDGAGPLAAIATPFGATVASNSCQAVPTSAFNNCTPGYLGGTPFFGKDINGDGDSLDTVTVIAPSQTQTKRLGLIAGLRWNVDANNTVRVNYTYDHARHRQTGEVGLLQANGEPFDVFPVNAGQPDATGSILQKRDRLSYAVLHQVSAEYRGEFMDSRLVLTAGLRMPFFKRDLTNNCYTSSAGGFVECFGTNAAAATRAGTLNPYGTSTAANGALIVTGWSPPQKRVLNYKKLLPNVGFVFNVAGNASLFGNFSQGLSVPSTDNLYNAFYFPLSTARARPSAETTDNFDLGMRFRSGMIQAQVSGFYNQFHNRLASAYDPDINQTVYRNLGNVKKYGIDGSIAFQPDEHISFYMFGSLLSSEIHDNIAISENTDGTPIYALTAGKRESGAAKYSFGGSVRANVGPFEVGFLAKRTGERYVYDNNEAVFIGAYNPSGAKACSSATTCTTPVVVPATGVKQVYGATAPAYWLVNMDIRVKLAPLGLADSYFQVNVYNLFNQLYVGGFGGNLNQTQTFAATTGTAAYGSVPNVQIGAPRTVSATVVFKF